MMRKPIAARNRIANENLVSFMKNLKKKQVKTGFYP